MEKKGEHEERAGQTCAQRSSSVMQWRSDRSGGTAKAGTRTLGKETKEAGGTPEENGGKEEKFYATIELLFLREKFGL